MQKTSKLIPFARITALASAVLLAGGVALAQTGSPSPGGQPGQEQQQPTQPSEQQQIQNQQQMQNSGVNNQQMDKMQAQAQDSMFVKHALQGGLAEVQLGQMALQKSSNAQVKDFAQRMIDDHTKLNDDMKPVAQQLGVSVPAKLDKKDNKTVAKLSALSGPEFDQAYIKDMVTDHKQDLRDFKDEAGSTQNPALKTAAAQGAQVINAHLQLAEQLASQQKASAGE